MKVRRFLRELKRRKVYRVAAAYMVVAWLVIQVATQTFPFLDIPEWVTRLVIVLVLLGFPLALILSWLFDLTPEGVKRTDDPGATASAPLAGIPPVTEKSIAVLPFDNLSDDPHNAYFADGVHDDILTSLARVGDLKVISRISVQQYRTGTRNLREIASTLGVAHILEGTVRRSGNRIRVNAQLINARADAHVWGESFDRELTDLFAIQTELAERIVTALRANLSAREKAELQLRPTSDLAAYELYLRAREFFNWSGVGDAHESGLRAVPILEQAVQRDPNFALAYALLSRVHAELYWFGHDKRRDRIELARTMAERALRLQPGLGEGHLALGFYHYYAARDYQRARLEFDSALQSTPNDSELVGALGIVARREGRWDDALGHLERAWELDPRNSSMAWNLIETYTLAGRYAGADAAASKALALAPQAHFLRLAQAALSLRDRGETAPLRQALASLPADFDPGGAVSTVAVRVALMERDYEAAKKRIEKNRADFWNDNGLSGMAGFVDGYNVPVTWYSALIALDCGDRAEAEHALEKARALVRERLGDSSSADVMMMLGLIEAASGRRAEALRLGRRAAELLPVARDAMDGAAIETNLAALYTILGEQELALDHLEQVAVKPGGPSAGLLRAERAWDPLRTHPRFMALLDHAA